MDKARRTIPAGGTLNPYWQGVVAKKKIARLKNSQLSLKEKFRMMDAMQERSDKLRNLSPTTTR